MILDGESTWDGERGYHVFDILWLDGRDVTPLPLEERRALLAQLPFAAAAAARRAARRRRSRGSARAREGWEGVIAKRRGSPYEHRRSKHWLKMKCEASQELVVGGFTDPQGARVGLGALLVGYYDGDDFVFAGKVGTGFDTKLLLDLRARLDALEIPQSPFTKADRAAAAARALGHARRSSCRSRSSNGPVHGKLRHSAAARRPHRQGGARRRAGAAVITHPDKVLFPDDGITKGDLAAYYEAIAPCMLPHLRGRPMTMERYPRGIGEKGSGRRTCRRAFPRGCERVEVPKKDGVVHHPLVTDARSLLWMTNQNTITQHVWASRAPDSVPPGHLRVRSRSVEGRRRTCCARRRSALRDLLDELGLPCWVKTSGSKGFHIVVPLDGRDRLSARSSRFAHAVGALLVQR